MAPLRGWRPRGRRLKALAPYGHWKTLTFIAALRHDRIDAPLVIDGPINGELFLLYVETILPPPRHQPAALIRLVRAIFRLAVGKPMPGSFPAVEHGSTRKNSPRLILQSHAPQLTGHFTVRDEIDPSRAYPRKFDKGTVGLHGCAPIHASVVSGNTQSINQRVVPVRWDGATTQSRAAAP